MLGSGWRSPWEQHGVEGARGIHPLPSGRGLLAEYGKTAVRAGCRLGVDSVYHTLLPFHSWAQIAALCAFALASAA
jgi:hypothetical protein